jgi:exodeoxyribonuclease VII large subunit
LEVTVSQLNNYIKSVFTAEEMLHGISVSGEIEGLKGRLGAEIGGSRVQFFALKDCDSVISCSCWETEKLEGIKDGDKVIAVGSVEYWNKKGKINFSVYSVKKQGVGDLLEQLRLLTEKLKAEGLFDRKKPLPAEVKRIGVVTSKSGAVIQDIITVTKRRNPNVDIVLYPVTVQGETAAAEISAGLSYFSRSKTVNLVILARGGGSADDLSVFNEESVARSVASCKIPVVSAVGHERDTTLVDFVADLRAPTPSAAAEMVVAEFVSKKETAILIWEQMKYIMTTRLENIKQEALNFLNIFPKDFVAVAKNGVRIKSVKGLKPKDRLQICFNDGKVGVTVDG